MLYRCLYPCPDTNVIYGRSFAVSYLFLLSPNSCSGVCRYRYVDAVTIIYGCSIAFDLFRFSQPATISQTVNKLGALLRGLVNTLFVRPFFNGRSLNDAHFWSVVRLLRLGFMKY